MDVDADQPTRYSPFIHFFDTGASSFPWAAPRPEQIRLRRAAMDDTLIFDILLTSGSVGDPYVLYPPETPEDLQRLLDKIESSNYDALKKDCLVYFLLKWHQDGRERHFMEQRCIPPQFVALADAYWHLDTGVNIPRAVALLADPRLNRDYSSKIIRTISLAPDSASLVRRYVQTAKPLLVEPPDIDAYALSLAELSIFDAWKFSRTFNEQDPTRDRLLRKILEWSLLPHPRPQALKQLLHLPLSSFEEKVLVSFASPTSSSTSTPFGTPVIPFSSLSALQTLLTTRFLFAGRHIDAIKLDSDFYHTTPQKFVGSREVNERRKMIKDIYDALGSVEKSLAALELDGEQSRPPAVPKAKSAQNGHAKASETRRAGIETPSRPPIKANAADISQSWEEVRVPDALLPKSTPLRDVRLPPAQIPGTIPRFPAFVSGFGEPTQSPSAAPVLPQNGIANGNKTTARKSLPLSQLGPVQPRSTGQKLSLGTPTNASPFGGSLNHNAVASPLSGMKLPPAAAAGSRQGHSGFRQSFVSANQQSNAFYKPVKQANGVKRAFEEDTVAKDQDMDQDMNAEAAHTSQRMDEDVQEDTGKDDGFHFSVFSGKNASGGRAVSGGSGKKRGDTAASKRTSRKRGVPPGAYGEPEQEEEGDSRDAEENDAEAEHHDSPSASGRTRRSTRTLAQKGANAISASATSKPPAKKARKSKGSEHSPSKKPALRTIPGGLMEDEEDGDGDDGGSQHGSAAPSGAEEEDDQVAPLPKAKRGTRGTGKTTTRTSRTRASTSAESLADELGTRRTRRSTRLEASASGGVEDADVPAAITKGRKSTKAPPKKSSRR